MKKPRNAAAGRNNCGENGWDIIGITRIKTASGQRDRWRGQRTIARTKISCCDDDVLNAPAPGTNRSIRQRLNLLRLSQCDHVFRGSPFTDRCRVKPPIECFWPDIKTILSHHLGIYVYGCGVEHNIRTQNFGRCRRSERHDWRHTVATPWTRDRDADHCPSRIDCGRCSCGRARNHTAGRRGANRDRRGCQVHATTSHHADSINSSSIGARAEFRESSGSCRRIADWTLHVDGGARGC